MAEERKWEGKYCLDQYYRPPDEAEVARKMVGLDKLSTSSLLKQLLCSDIQHLMEGDGQGYLVVSGLICQSWQQCSAQPAYCHLAIALTAACVQTEIP